MSTYPNGPIPRPGIATTVKFSHMPAGTISRKRMEHPHAGVNRTESNSAGGLLEVCLSHHGQIPSLSHFPGHKKTKNGANVVHSQRSIVFTLNVRRLGPPRDSARAPWIINAKHALIGKALSVLLPLFLRDCGQQPQKRTANTQHGTCELGSLWQ